MLATSSVNLKGTESFEEAFSLINNVKVNVRELSYNGEDAGVYQIYDNNKNSWGSPRTKKKNKDGSFESLNFNSKEKLRNTEIFYDVFSKPTYAGSNDKNSWLIGDINNCEIAGENYNIQGLIISSIFDPIPKYYISFERLACENQFGSLGTSNSSMYINMNSFLGVNTSEAKEKLVKLINSEVEERIAMQEAVINKLKGIHLDYDKIESMFKKLTVDTVAKNSINYENEEAKLVKYIQTYNSNDNQNYRETFMGFVNTCTNVNTRTKTSPIDVVKPVISPAILAKPCNFEYLCRDVLVNAA